jgi:autophagy-related protein 2
MPWCLGITWPESLKKRACRYLLQRYLGQFLEEKLTLDQLTVDLYNGTGTVSEVRLDVQVRITTVYSYCYT